MLQKRSLTLYTRSKCNVDQQHHISRKVTPKVVLVPINYVITLKLNMMRIYGVVDYNVLACEIAYEIIEDKKHEAQIIIECRHQFYWPKLKEVIHIKLYLLVKHLVFGSVVQALEVANPC
ncbi:MAG: hypothetical protein Q8877_03495 [Sweet potato little leaf phytoplasma]|nr:hypothetical protein [Sweet potato little leaf phytoplasma]